MGKIMFRLHSIYHTVRLRYMGAPHDSTELTKFWKGSSAWCDHEKSRRLPLSTKAAVYHLKTAGKIIDRFIIADACDFLNHLSDRHEVRIPRQYGNAKHFIPSRTSSVGSRNEGTFLIIFLNESNLSVFIVYPRLWRIASIKSPAPFYCTLIAPARKMSYLSSERAAFSSLASRRSFRAAFVRYLLIAGKSTLLQSSGLNCRGSALF